MSPWICRICVVVLGGWLCLGAPWAARAGPPFSPGEDLRFGVRWEQVAAGSCWLKILPPPQKDNAPAWHFRLKAESNSLVDALHKIRERVDSLTALDFSTSILYRHQASGRKQKDILVQFYPDKGQVQYANYGGKRDPVDIVSMTLDPLAALYRVRSLDLDVGQRFTLPVTDGKKAFFQKGEIVRRERVSVPWGTVDALVLVPYTTHFSGVFERSEDPRVQVWISDDERRLPVKIQIKVVIGSIHFDLEHAVLPDLE